MDVAQLPAQLHSVNMTRMRNRLSLAPARPDSNEIELTPSLTLLDTFLMDLLRAASDE